MFLYVSPFFIHSRHCFWGIIIKFCFVLFLLLYFIWFQKLVKDSNHLVCLLMKSFLKCVSQMIIMQQKPPTESDFKFSIQWFNQKKDRKSSFYDILMILSSEFIYWKLFFFPKKIKDLQYWEKLNFDASIS